MEESLKAAQPNRRLAKGDDCGDFPLDAGPNAVYVFHARRGDLDLPLGLLRSRPERQAGRSDLVPLMVSDTLKESAAADTAARRRSILIVDDDEATADVLSLRLGQQGFATTTADTGDAALKLARSQPRDLILLDLRLPDVDGLTLCQLLVDDEETAGVPIIIVSGMERPDIVRQCRAAGCHYFVRKPYDPNALLALVERAIDEAETL